VRYIHRNPPDIVASKATKGVLNSLRISLERMEARNPGNVSWLEI